jgi:hypothetical protein
MTFMNRELTRRETLVQILRAGGLGAAGSWMSRAWALDRHLHGSGEEKKSVPGQGDAMEAGPYQPNFFSPEQYTVIRNLASMIIPTDETPGAREARVEEWIDFILSQSDVPRQEVCRRGMVFLESLCRERHAKSFQALPETTQTEILQTISDEVPETAENRAGVAFFRALKHDTIVGFYTSEIGLKELDYKGNTFYSECPGCDHPEHLNLQA